MGRFDPNYNLTKDQELSVADVRNDYAELERILNIYIEFPSREKSLALTALEESAFWAIRAITMEKPE